MSRRTSPRGRRVAGAGVPAAGWFLVEGRRDTIIHSSSQCSAANGLDSLRYLKDLEVVWKGWNMGAVIMLGTLFGLTVLVFGLVLRYDPEARRAQGKEHGE